MKKRKVVHKNIQTKKRKSNNDKKKKPKTYWNALLIMPGVASENNPKLIQINKKNMLKDLYKHIDCNQVQMAPKFMEKLQYDKKHVYHFEMWIDEEGGPYCKNRDYNGCATVTNHPNGELIEWCRVHGPAILIRTVKGGRARKDFTLDDWKKIVKCTQAFAGDIKLVEKNIKENSLI